MHCLIGAAQASRRSGVSAPAPSAPIFSLATREVCPLQLPLGRRSPRGAASSVRLASGGAGCFWGGPAIFGFLSIKLLLGYVHPDYRPFVVYRFALR
jgi:hypothetical protein